MTENATSMLTLAQAIQDYLLWLIDNNYAQSTCRHYEQVLRHFEHFITVAQIGWQDVFTLPTLQAFKRQSRLQHFSVPVRGLSRYLWRKGSTSRPLEKPLERLPEIYEQYIAHHERTRSVHRLQLLKVRSTLQVLSRYLAEEHIKLATITIDQIDAFLTKRNAGYCAATQANQRSNLRGFLRYLYHERSITRRDLAPLVVGAMQFAQAKPARFLSERELQQLFACRQPVTAHELRAYALLQLAYSLGLRPREISLIKLDDISFGAGEITLPERKNTRPLTLPVPENCIKAIAAYIIGGRPKSSLRSLFLQHKAPYAPLSAAMVGNSIKACMRKAGLSGTAYQLRHSYAQRLLESGSEIIDIKNLMGHDRILTTQRYLHIHTGLMRKVLFDETI